MTEVFAGVRRILRDDGTLWLNVAGSYAVGKSGRADGGRLIRGVRTHTTRGEVAARDARPGWKPKDFVNVPALLAESLRADGWFLRAEIALCKVAPMPESVRDRPTRATERLYLFAKRGKYFYDGEAEKPGAVMTPQRRFTDHQGPHDVPGQADHQGVIPARAEKAADYASRNLWDWWDESDDDLPEAAWEWRPEPSKVRHYATFPLWLPLRCIRLATSAHGCCGRCGAPWRRVVEREGGDREAADRPKHLQSARSTLSLGGNGSKEWAERGSATQTLGWSPSCRCPPSDAVPATVLDPFCGTATTGAAARLLGRRFVGIDLSSEYCAIARERLAGCVPLDDAACATPPPAPPPQRGLFDPLQ
jgi:DNA modification methylase